MIIVIVYACTVYEVESDFPIEVLYILRLTVRILRVPSCRGRMTWHQEQFGAMLITHGF